MNRSDFEASVHAEGYLDLVDRRMEANAVNPEHAHEFDARVLVLEGEMTIRCGGAERTWHSGEAFAITAGRRHAEHAGAEGVRYLAGRRYPPNPAP